MKHSRGIPVSEKHGFNPSMLQCTLCGSDYGLALCGRLPGDVEAPRRVAQGVCDECIAHMKTGILIVITPDGQPNQRTGQMLVVTQAGAEKVFTGYDFSKQRGFLLEQSLAKKVGLLPEEDQPPIND